MCQPWAADFPFILNTQLADIHKFGLVRNYCRNPDNSPGGPWCYTSDANVEREDCVVQCESGLGQRIAVYKEVALVDNALQVYSCLLCLSFLCVL